VSTPILSASESEESLYHDHSSGTSSWESEVSVEDGDGEMIQADIDPWIKHLNILWDILFEQRESPTEDKVTQINLGDKANPKPIFIRKAYYPPRRKI